MYTQCPDCSTAFKVTAEVLRQAAGKVRCGGCGNAFDALSYLSEAMPQQSTGTDSDAAVPELKPEAVDTSNSVPRSISAEQSAALLRTLDQLAGSDIRIEDTGVEWRVLDETDNQDAAAPANSIDADIEANNDGAEEPVDELLQESPTPVDEFLTQTPEVVEAPEIFDAAAASSVDELRFDDNTPLPDDFDFGDAPEDAEAMAAEPEIAAEEDSSAAIEEPPRDITLSEPEEWQDILGEFEDIAGELRAGDTADDAQAVGVDEAEDAESAAVDHNASGILDVDTQFALQAEELGLDVTGIHDSDAGDEPEAAIADDVAEVEEVAADVGADETIVEASGESVAELQLALDDAEVLAESLEEASETASDSHPMADGDESAALREELAVETSSEMTIADELAALEALDDAGDDDLDLDEPDAEDSDLDEAAVDELDIVDPADIALEAEPEPFSLEDAEPQPEHFVAPLTEEEQSVNMQIDQDLMALAVEDEDGFASTIVIPPERTEEHAKETAPPKRNIALNETSDGFETIVMEGETVQTAIDEGQLGVDAAASSEIRKMIDANELESLPPPAKQHKRIVTGVIALSLLIVLQVLHQSREALATNPTINNAIGPIYRALGSPIQPKWDVTGWRFEATTDISQSDIVEQPAAEADTDTDADADEDSAASADDATADTTDAIEEPPRLTVYSIIGNKSDAPLPYPLIAISLTDRYDATIGNTLLLPEDYLPEEQSADELVAPGNSFNAMINIEPLPEAATGFKLDVCYRLDDQQLRCALEDFK